MDGNKTQALSTDPNRTQLGTPPSADPNRTMMGTAPTLNATVTIKPTQCPVCKTFNPAGVMFCVDCGLIFDRALPDDAFGAPAVQLPCLVDTSGREHTIRPGENIIGREGDILLQDPKSSRKHAKVTSADGRMQLEDLGSTNGTTLNGEKIQAGDKKELNEGDTIGIGSVELKVSVPGKAGATAVVSGNKTAAISAAPKVEKPPAYLVGADEEFPLKPGVNTFGRKSENDVQISDPYVSGKHGEIEIKDDGVYLTDTGSTNGTVLNDAKLAANQKVSVKPDDVIKLGSLEFKVRIEEN